MKIQIFSIIAGLFLMINSPVFARDFNIIGIPGEPLRFYNDQNQLTGIDVDIITEIMDRLDIPFSIKLISSSARLENFREDSSTDMIFTYSYNDERAKYLIYPEESHITLSWNFFYLKEYEGMFDFETFEDLKGLKVGATIGFSYTPEFWQAADDEIFILDLVVKNELNLLKLIGNRFDLYPNSRIDTLYQARSSGFLDKITYLPKPLKEKKYYNTFVRKSDYPDLDSIIQRYDEELRNMKKEGLIQNIYDKYLNDSEESY
jgi:polar amino acid transport system substrate-binding protein